MGVSGEGGEEGGSCSLILGIVPVELKSVLDYPSEHASIQQQPENHWKNPKRGIPKSLVRHLDWLLQSPAASNNPSKTNEIINAWNDCIRVGHHSPAD